MNIEQTEPTLRTAADVDKWADAEIGEWAGNHAHDSERFAKLDAIIRDTRHTTEARLRAVYHTDRGMGCEDEEPYTEQTLRDICEM